MFCTAFRVEFCNLFKKKPLKKILSLIFPYQRFEMLRHYDNSEDNTAVPLKIANLFFTFYVRIIMSHIVR